MRVIHYVALGDSLTAGYGAPEGAGFVDRVREGAENRLRCTVTLDNFGRNGAKSGDLAEWLVTDDTLRESVRKAQLITITAGGNDLLEAAKPFYLHGETAPLVRALKTMRTHYQRLLALIYGLKAKQDCYCIRLVGLYNPISWSTDANVWVERFNRHIQRLERDMTAFVDVYGAFRGQEDRLLNDDLIHPNVEGYRVITEQVIGAGFGPLEMKKPSFTASNTGKP